MTSSKPIEKIQEQQFWALPVVEVLGLLRTDTESGLTETEAIKRLKMFGPNVIEKPRRASGFFIFLNQLKSPLILILVIAGIITLLIDHFRDAVFIFAAVVVNTALGFYQEYKAEKALAELKTYLKQRARVIRGGQEHEVDASSLVPGDIIQLTQGDRIPADGRLIFANDLQIDEAILTGEALPESKSTEPVAVGSFIGDQSSMVFAGTLVNQGVGTAIVCRTDFATELGKIATLVSQSRREETPLQSAIKKFSMKAGIFLGILTVIIFGAGVAMGYSRIEMFLTAVAIAVAAVPEGLPVAMTVILATGVQRMARRRGVIRKLIAAETLGSTTVILTDKTGTLTMAKMELSKVLPTTGEDEDHLLELALTNTSVLIENSDAPATEWRLSGRILEMALVRSAGLRGILAGDVKDKISILSSLPFNAANKFSASLIHDGEKHELLFLGAPDIFVKHSTLTDIEQENTLNEIDSLATAGGLVVGVAM